MIPLFFNVNCTVPPTITHYVSGASTRGTLDIVWGALTVLFLCVWSNQHLNVPPQWRPSEEDSKTTSKFSRICKKIARHCFLFNRSFRWMIINLASPEFVTAKALLDMISAKGMHKRLKPRARDDGVDWSMAHTHYANMGGFVIRFENKDQSLAEKPNHNDTEVGLQSSEPDGARRPSSGYGCRDQHDGESYPGDTVKYDERRNCLVKQAGNLSECIRNGNPNQPELCGVASQSPVDRISEDRVREYQTHYAENSYHRTKADIVAARRRGMVFNVYEISADTTCQAVEQEHPSAETDESLDSFTDPTRLFDTELAQNMKGDLTRILENRVWGVERYLERVRDFKASFGFDWEIDERNREAVFKAFDEYGRYDMRQFPLMPWYHNVSALQGNVWYVDAAQLLFAREVGIITSLPSLPHEQLDDQTKNDFLMKSITLVQIIWLTLQLIARQTEGLPAAQIEIVALSFAACSLFACILMWEKPQGVEACSYITASRWPSSQEIRSLGVIGPTTSGQKRVYPWICNNSLHTHARARSWLFVSGMWICATLFGGIHCFSWNSHFPTPVERLLWRMSCLVLAIEPSILSAVSVYFAYWHDRNRKTSKMRREVTVSYVINNVLLLILSAPYVLGRLYLIVETVRSLFYLPPEVFVATNWPDYLPHFM
ncbi:hypothetical protein DTO027B9_1285 [Paecilomyces variotii]|nr:hypothetical protein DTO027B3_6160 [Paecilomyces variotii]KAJ9360301.1 hypothetical protein DTO027B9_1285 [Paecilomyces variotii]